MSITLFDYQLDAVKRMKNGCILCGGVGSGKSLTALSYYYLQNGGEASSLVGGDYIPMDDPPKDLYIITTARKETRLNGRVSFRPSFFLPIRTTIFIMAIRLLWTHGTISESMSMLRMPSSYLTNSE